MNAPLLEFDTALSELLAAARPLDTTELVRTQNALGRILAETIVSSVSVPPLDNSSMDGYAVRSADITQPGIRMPVSQRIPAGTVGRPLQAGSAARIFTGAPIPQGADAVVMQEACAADGDDVIVNHQPRPGEWIRRAGEDIRAGTEVLVPGTRLRPQELGMAASAGRPEIRVFCRLRVALFSTGDELIMPGEPLPPGAIYNSNRYTLYGLLESIGCEVVDLGIVPDTLEAARAALREAATRSDLIVSSGGMSVGEEDHMRPAVQAEGTLALWRLAIRPGRPLAFGQVRKAQGETPFIGLPGNPVGAFVTFLLLVRPFIQRSQGMNYAPPRPLQLVADFDWPHPDARREFLRARLNEEGMLELFSNQSAGVLTSTVWADGLIDNPSGGVIRQGDVVRFLPFNELLS